jgi:hypothetical protein
MKPPHLLRLCLASLIAGTCVLSGAARASETDFDKLPWKRGGLFLGGTITTVDTTARLGSDAAGLALEVNMEDAFGLDTTTQSARFGGFWRFGDSMRNRVTLDYYSMKRTASKTLEQDVTIGDSTFPAGTGVSSETKIGILKATYEYSFLMNESVDLSAAFGLYTMPFSFQFDGASSNENQDFTAPLPVIGLHLDVALQDNLFLRQKIDLFYLEYGNFRGGMTDVYLGLEWFPWERFGFGLGLESFILAIEAESDYYPGLALNGDLKYQQTGLFLYATYAF